MKKPTALDERVKKLHNVVSSEDLHKQKMITPGPGSYEHLNSHYSTINQSSRGTAAGATEQDHQQMKQLPNRRAASGLTIPKYRGERCVFEEGETYSPGPARYSMAEAQEKM